MNLLRHISLPVVILAPAAGTTSPLHLSQPTGMRGRQHLVCLPELTRDGGLPESIIPPAGQHPWRDGARMVVAQGE